MGSKQIKGVMNTNSSSATTVEIYAVLCSS